MKKWVKYLFFGIGLLYAYAIARVLSHSLSDEHSDDADDQDWLVH